MSCTSSGVLQPSGLTEATFLHISNLSSSQQFDVRWANGESRVAELLSRIQPNGHAELRRKAVADYISGLVQKCLNCEVFRFGSVPLKTYLPDGDIDLTAFTNHQELRDSWALDVKTVLEHEVQRKDAEFTISNVQCIHAEVKIVKCVVDNIVVDISFNQLGGLCTLCFLEEVDRLIQKNHLFKRSIILVKAWCYYESRILGAHHALISTYALETLVLYIFNVFHPTLRGPLEVLFTFLDYFSKFDWENYCVSLWGPVPLAALPNLTAETPLEEGSKLLLSKGFLEACSALYDVFPKGGDTQARTFSGKFLNIVDPLRVNNNLGRSVSQASYHRIRSAFRLGARQLAKVFEVVDEDFPKCLDAFFSNTWERHQSGHRPDAPTSAFLPYEKFVYKTEYFDMLGDAGAKYIFRSPELKASIGDGVPKTRLNVQSTLMCNLPSAVSTDSQLRTSSLGRSGLESRAPSETCKAPASLKRSTSERRLEKRLDTDMMKSWCPLNTVDAGESLLKCPVEDGQCPGMPKAGILNSSFSDVFLSKAASDSFAVMHAQSTSNTGFVRGKSWPTFNSQESKKRAPDSAASNCIRTRCTSSATEDPTTSNTAIQKPPGFLFPESRDLLKAHIDGPLDFPELAGEKVQNLACASSGQIKPFMMAIESSQGPPSEDARRFGSHIPQLDEMNISQTPSQYQKFEEQHQQHFQFLQQPELAWLQPNSGMYPFFSNDHSATHAGNDGSNITGEASVNGHTPLPSEKIHLSRSKGDVYKGTEVTMAKASAVQEGGNYMAQGSPTGAIPVGSYYHPFYPAFPASSFSAHIPYQRKAYMDGFPRENMSHIYHGSGQIPDSSTAALSARFASLSAEESGIKPPQDLLRSDLTNHLRNLEFGRWCQEPALQPSSEPPFMYHSGHQDPYLRGSVAPFTPPYGSSNQVVENLKGPASLLFSPQNVGGMSHIVSGPGTSNIAYLRKQGTGTGTFLPVRNSVSRDVKPLSPQTTLQHDQGPTQKKTHFTSMRGTSALVASPSQHSASNGVTNVEAFVNTVGEHGAMASSISNHLESPGGILPVVAGQLEFGSLGPIEITSFPCSNVGTKQSSIYNTGVTSSGGYLPFFETQGNTEALLNDKPREGP